MDSLGTAESTKNLENGGQSKFCSYLPFIWSQIHYILEWDYLKCAFCVTSGNSLGGLFMLADERFYSNYACSQFEENLNNWYTSVGPVLNGI